MLLHLNCMKMLESMNNERSSRFATDREVQITISMDFALTLSLQVISLIFISRRTSADELALADSLLRKKRALSVFPVRYYLAQCGRKVGRLRHDTATRSRMLLAVSRTSVVLSLFDRELFLRF